MTMTQKIIAAHAGLQSVTAGQLIEAKLDLVLGNDVTSPVAINEMAKKGFKDVFSTDKIAALCKLAADFSDGIIQQSEHVNEEVLNYARESGKPVLEYQSPENFAEACNDFYDKVWETEQK